MRASTIIFLLWLVVPAVYAQSEDKRIIDSLQAVLRRTPSAKAYVDIQNSIAERYYNLDLKKSLHFAQAAFERSRNLRYDRGVQQSLNTLMRVQRRLGNFSAAIDYNLTKIPIAERLKDTLDLVDSYSSLGNIYSSLERYKESVKYLTEAYTMGKAAHVANLGSIMNFLGRSYGKSGKYDSAMFWIRKALHYEMLYPQEDYTRSYIYNNLGEVYFYRRQYDSAKRYYTLSLNLPEKLKSNFGLTFSLNGMARVQQATNAYPQAIETVLKSILISRKYGYRDKTKEAYGILHEVYSDMRDYKNALHYYKLFNLYQDSIFSEDKLQYIENLKLDYETNRVAKENELLRKNAELKDARINEQRSIAWAAVLAIGSLLILLLIVYLNYKRKKKTNLMLATYNDDLSAQVEERTKDLVSSNLELIRQNNQLEQFGYIIAHNLRAPVARILGLTNIIKSDHFSMPEDKGAVDRLQHSAEDLDTIIHDLNIILEIKKGVHYSFETIDIREKLTKVKSILKEKIKESGVSIREQLAQDSVCYGIPAYVESILYNLMSNAIKYRSPERVAWVKVFTDIRDNSLEIIVEDNGIGMDLDGTTREKIFNLYQRFHDHVEGKGIGLFLVKTQVEALNGTIDLESKPDEGTRFTILIQRKNTSADS